MNFNNMPFFPFFNMPFPNPMNCQQMGAEGEAQTGADANANVDASMMGMFQEMFKNMHQMCGVNPQFMNSQFMNPQFMNPQFMNPQFMNPQFMHQQFQGMFQNMFPGMGPMCGMNPQGMQNPNMMQYMNPYMFMQTLMSFGQEALKYVKPLLEKLKDSKSSNLPFGLPAGVLQYLLNMDSSPESLSKLQKVLDVIFDYYSKPTNQNHFDVPEYEKPQEKTENAEAAAEKTEEAVEEKPAESASKAKEQSDMPEPPEFVKKMIAEGKNPEMPAFVKKMLEEKNKK